MPVLEEGKDLVYIELPSIIGLDDVAFLNFIVYHTILMRAVASLFE